MSFKLFLQGKSPEEIQQIKSQKGYVDNPTYQKRQKQRTEQQQEIVRGMQKWHDLLSELERAVWERISGQKQLPKPVW